MLVEIFVASIGQVPNRVCLTTMVPALGAERTSVELRASLADRGTSVFLDGSVEVLRALGSRSKANELVQFLKCCYEAEDGGVQVTTVAMLVLGLASAVDNWFAVSGKQMTVQLEDVAALMPRLPSKKRFQRVDSDEADLFHWRDTTEASKDHHQLRTGSSRRLVLRRCCRIQLQKHDCRSRCELCRVESPCVRGF